MESCHCCSGPVKRFGTFKNRNRTVQRYRCEKCSKTFSENQPLDGVRIEKEKAAQVIHLLAEGVGIRAASRLTGLDQGTILNILKTAGEHCARLVDAKIQNITAGHVEIDEIYGFVKRLQKNTDEGDTQEGDQYAFFASESTSKCILHWHVGKRDNATINVFLNGLKPRIVGRFQLSTDGFRGYTSPYGGVPRVFGSEVDYATEIKRYGPERPYSSRRFNRIICTSVRRQRRSGNPNLGIATVNHAERTNLSVRLFNRRFTRKTLGYSKTLENHKYAMVLLVAHYNFCRTHSALKIKATETTEAKERTPAQAQGLTDHKWTVEELLTATI
jgi:IS1 family transposase/transposase-like protein